MVNPEETVFVNALMRQELVTVQEELGENRLNAVLRSMELARFVGNFPSNDTNPGINPVENEKFNESIETYYARAGKGMLRCID